MKYEFLSYFILLTSHFLPTSHFTMETYPISLALFDFIPTFAFLIGAFHLVRIAIMQRGSACGRMAMAGSLLIFLGGFLKAGWKLLYAANIADVQWMSQLQFILVAPGFLALLVTAILTARGKKKAAMPIMAIAVWKIPLLAIMTLSSMGAQGILAYMAFQRHARLAAVGFIIAFLCLVGMGAMASGEQTLARQWIEEGINTIGQLGFMLGSILLHQNYKASGCGPSTGD
jgi:hypothetical protein